MTKYETSAALNVFEIKFTTDDKDAALRVQDLCKEEVERARRETIKEKVIRFSERIAWNIRCMEEAKIPKKNMAVFVTQEVMDAFELFHRTMFRPEYSEMIMNAGKTAPKFMAYPVEVVQGNGEKAWVGVRVDLGVQDG